MASFHHFTLYLIWDTRRAHDAIARVEALLASFDPSVKWVLDIVDVLEDPDAATAAGVWVTPTLHCTGAGAEIRFVGLIEDLDEARALLGLAPAAGV